MIFRAITICVLLSLVQTPTASADVVNFVLDSTLSSASVTVGGVGPESSQTSGTGVLLLTPSTPPFGVAQVTEMDIVLDDALFFDLGAMVTASTTAGDVTINLDTPGAPGAVSSGQFDQTGNLMVLGGDVEVSDPLNITGGDQTIDLSTLMPSLVDFNAVTLSRTGDIVTISGSYNIDQTILVGTNDVDVLIAGVFVASGVVTVPEPSTMVILLSTLALVATKRRRF